MSVAEVAQSLSRSKAWVSMRRRLLEEMSESIQQILFQGTFPVYSYMYTLRPFMRMNSVKPEQIERFVKVVAGKGLSVREIELLADGYFKGPASLREAIDEGKLGWSLDQFERVLLADLQTLQKYLERVMLKSDEQRLQSRAFFAQANLLVGGLLTTLEPFRERMKEFYDRSGHA
jgi:hypothetical protein